MSNKNKDKSFEADKENVPFFEEEKEKTPLPPVEHTLNKDQETEGKENDAQLEDEEVHAPAQKPEIILPGATKPIGEE